MKIATHDAKFHTDDVFAVASLLILYPDAEIVRTRDEELAKRVDVVVDLGQKYDAEKNLFDHHQQGGAGKRENGIEYASFGLIWKKYGNQITNSEEIANEIDKNIVQYIDATDNGQNVFSSKIENFSIFTISNIVDQFRATWKEDENWDQRFLSAVDWAKKFMERKIKITGDFIEGKKVAVSEYKKSEDKNLVVIDEAYDLGREIVMDALVDFPEPIYAILYRKDTRSWQVLAIRRDSKTFESRKLLPEAWRGKMNIDLEKISGVAGATFCHRSGFMCVANTKEAALKLAEIALNS